jgi:hypothetical protein
VSELIGILLFDRRIELDMVLIHNRIHSLKILNASHTSSIYKYMNTKLKLLNCNANLYFNRKCLELNLTPIYAQTKIKMNPHNKIVNEKMIEKFQRTRIKNEINVS